MRGVKLELSSELFSLSADGFLLLPPAIPSGSQPVLRKGTLYPPTSSVFLLHSQAGTPQAAAEPKALPFPWKYPVALKACTHRHVQLDQRAHRGSTLIMYLVQIQLPYEDKA